MKELSLSGMENIQGGVLAGQDAMNCFADAYLNNGWISLWASIQTAFIPMTAALIAAACIGRNI
jgi:hypothetical protein